MLQDSQGRRFTYLRLSITDVCNYRCNYCLPDGYHCEQRQKPLTVAEISRLTAAFAAAGTRKVRITGGEPSLRKDLPDIIAAIKQTPGIDTVALTTNGHRCLDKLPLWRQAGLDAINFSCDSLDSRLFADITGRNSLTDLLRAIDKACEIFPRVKANAVLLRQFNYRQLDDFFDWIRHKPLTLRFIELMETGDNRDFFRRNHVSGSELEARLRQQGWQPVLRGPHAGPAKEFHHPDYQGRCGIIAPYSKDFCASCNRLRVSSLGKLHLCLFADAGIDIRPLLQEGQQQALQHQLQALLADKKASHYLADGYTGATRHLAMLGG